MPEAFLLPESGHQQQALIDSAVWYVTAFPKRSVFGVGVLGSLLASGGFGVLFDLRGVGLDLPGVELLSLAHRLFDVVFQLRHTDDHKTCLPLVEIFTQLLEVMAAHPSRCMSAHSTENGTAGGCSREQTTADRRERKQGHDEPGSKSHATAEHSANPGWGFVLLGDAYLSALPLFDHRG